MKRSPLDLNALPVGTRVEEPLLVTEVSRRSRGDGSPYAVLTLGNSSGGLQTEPFWSERLDEVAGVRAGQVAQIIGEIATYRDRRQIRVTSFRILPEGMVDPADLLPSVGGPERYWRILDAWREEIGRPRLRQVLDLFFEEDDFRSRFERCPAAVSGHHAALGGLLKHTAEVAAIARAIARVSGADQELVLAGVLLHDLGKLEAYSWERAFEFTRAGRLVGHVVLGALMLARRIDRESEAPCTEIEREILLHLILSHHGRLEFGSPITPMTLEAEVIHWADNASAKTATMAEALASWGGQDGTGFTAPVRSLDYRRVFRGGGDWGSEAGRERDGPGEGIR